ncbi:hypothetical protein MRX96_029381 [Rhipicephalus microplus]
MEESRLDRRRTESKAKESAMFLRRSLSTLPTVPVTRCTTLHYGNRRNAPECELSRDWLVRVPTFLRTSEK